MRNDYSKYTLIEMLRSYADGEEDTLGGNQRLDAADVIEQLQAENLDIDYLKLRIGELQVELNQWRTGAIVNCGVGASGMQAEPQEEKHE